MTDLRLPNAMNAPKALFDAVWVPRQVVVHHQVRALQVDSFTCGIRCEQHLHLGIMQKGFLRLRPLLATHPTVYGDYGFAPAQQGRDAGLQVAQRVAMLGEDHQLLSHRRHGRWDFASAVGSVGFGDAVGDRLLREDLAEQVRELSPFCVRPAAADRKRHRFELLQRCDFGL